MFCTGVQRLWFAFRWTILHPCFNPVPFFSGQIRPPPYPPLFQLPASNPPPLSLFLSLSLSLSLHYEKEKGKRVKMIHNTAVLIFSPYWWSHNRSEIPSKLPLGLLSLSFAAHVRQDVTQDKQQRDQPPCCDVLLQADLHASDLAAHTNPIPDRRGGCVRAEGLIEGSPSAPQCLRRGR